jgi:hypothetical protein
MVAQKKGMIAPQAVTIKGLEPLDLPAYIFPGTALIGLVRFNTAEIAMVKASIGNVDGDHLIIHMAGIRGKYRHPPADDGMQGFRSLEQGCFIVLQNKVYKLVDLGSQAMTFHLKKGCI